MVQVHGKVSQTLLIKECESYIKDLHRCLVPSLYNRRYSSTAKHPYKVMSFINAMSWRVYEAANSALKLIRNDLVVPSLCLVRAVWEDMALTYDLATLIETCCGNHFVPEDVDEKLMCFCFANRFDRSSRFVGEEYYESFKDYQAKNILTLVGKVEKAFPETKGFYSTICEFVHPNGDGVGGSYSRLDEESDTTFFGPQIDKKSCLFPAFVKTLSCAIMLYLSFLESIENNIDKFAKLCENSLAIKTSKTE